MEDLLKEDDFLQKPLRPWGRFALFYLAAVLTFTAFYLIMRYILEFSPTELLIIIFVIIIPVLYSLLMVFTKKSHEKIPYKTIVFAVAIMMTCYCATILSIGFLAQKIPKDAKLFQLLGSIIGLYTILWIITFSIIVPIIRIKRKRKNIKLISN